MPFIGTIINFACITIFSFLGSLVGAKIPERINRGIFSAIAICVAFVGIEGALESPPEACTAFLFGDAFLTKFVIVILSMVIGTVIGEIIDIDKWVNKLGTSLERKLSSKSLRLSGETDGEAGGIEKELDASSYGTGNFAKGFVSCTIMTCVGAMAVNGAILDAVGDPGILIAKSVIDAISCFIMATSLGIGCAFSAIPMLVYQGIITAIALLMAEFIPEACIYYLSVTGSFIIVLIGTNFIGATNVKTANMTPAVFVPMILVPLFELFA